MNVDENNEKWVDKIIDRKCGSYFCNILLFFILTIVLINPALAQARTIIVDDSGGTDYMKIQDAIYSSNPGDTIEVRSGIYYENVNVNKQLTLRGIGTPVIDASGSGSAITLAADGISLEGFIATGAGFYPDAGIAVTSNNNTLAGNFANSNKDCGISLVSSRNNTLTGNNASNNGFATGIGISLSSSNNNLLIGNYANSNYGFGGSNGIWMYSSNNNMLISNNANSNYDGIVLSYSNNNTLTGNNVNSNHGDGLSPTYGISLWFSSNNTLTDNNALNKIAEYKDNSYSIFLYPSSSNNKLIGNIV